ncbi:cellulose binding domain-containing protein [Micromonospora craniellae]|uniref:Cellulose-binding protein n=1 Tax=Micromonospora craniellae TaxID=2294034 RepID=A0A372FVF6_9ACTN|nr:cellulose binding domain-containing protein [Micromonospora craniellae]QOC93127.1 cellulose binding domain-containing protein [Micromonospora craniellae]RFS44777.1 cellulose-binding protein [Micromonospora craniellae]
MLRKSLGNAATAGLAAAVLALAAGSVAARPSAAAPAADIRPAPAVAAADPVRVMPLGDSITGSPGCWRAVLWNRLQSAGHTAVDFVGTLGPQGCGQPYDGDNEGHGGYLVTNVANQNLLPGWLSATRPDVVLMHFGTNDVWSNLAPATILAAYGRLVDQMRAANPAMRILVAKIIPMAPSSCPECGQRVVALNNVVDGWAAGKTTAQSPIVVVDQWTGFSTTTDTNDGVHPNAAGDRKIADRWYPALVAALTGVPVPTPTATPTPPATPTPTPPATPTPPVTPTPTMPPGGCVASYRVVGQWQGGFQGEVTVRNGGLLAMTGWTVRFDVADAQRITQAWGAEVVQSGTMVTARNVAWNGALASGAQTTFGFLASTGGIPTASAVSCTAS